MKNEIKNGIAWAMVIGLFVFLGLSINAVIKAIKMVMLLPVFLSEIFSFVTLFYIAIALILTGIILRVFSFKKEFCSGFVQASIIFFTILFVLTFIFFAIGFPYRLT